MKIKTCKHCNQQFRLKIMLKKGKYWPGNYVKLTDDCETEYYHKTCWEKIETEKRKKDKFTIGFNNFNPYLSYEREF